MDTDRPHDQKEGMLELSPEDRHRKIEHLRVAYPRLNKLARVINWCRDCSKEAAEPYCLLIYGPSGAGKTTLLETYAKAYPRLRDDTGVTAPVISATIPVPATMMTMAVALLDALGDPFADKGTLGNKTRRLVELIRKCGVELIILDEFQHFIDRDSDKVLQTVSDWLKNLIGATGVPVVLTGLPHCRKVLDANEQLHRRFSAQEELRPFIWSGDGQEEFRRFLAAIDGSLPFAELAGLSEPEVAWRLFCASQGLTAHVMKIVRGAAHNAIVAGVPRIDLAMLERAYAERILPSATNRSNPFSGQSPAGAPGAPPRSKPSGTGNRMRPMQRKPSVSTVLQGG